MGVETCDGSSPPQVDRPAADHANRPRTAREGACLAYPPGGPDGDRGHCDTVNCGVTTG